MTDHSQAATEPAGAEPTASTVDTAARGVALPFYTYAVLANAVFQRGVFVIFLAQLGFSAAQIALLQTLLYLVSGLAEIPTGFIADRVGRRASIVIGQLLMAACLLGQVTLSGYWVFLVLFAVHGIGIACVSGAETALLYDLLVRRGARTSYVKVKSRYTMLGTVTMGLAIALGGPLQQVSWEVVYIGSAVSLVFAAAVLLTRVPEIRGADAVDEVDEAGEPGADAEQTAWRAIVRIATPGLVALVVVSGLMHATLTPYFIFAQQALADQGAHMSLVSVVMSAGFLVGGLAPLLSVRADRRIGYRTLVPLTLAVLAGALALSGLGMVWVTVAAFLVAAAIPEITAVIVDNVFNEAVPSRHRASLLSLITFVESALIACGYLGLGALMDGLGSSAGLAAYAAVPVVACLLWLPTLRGGAKTKAAAEETEVAAAHGAS